MTKKLIGFFIAIVIISGIHYFQTSAQVFQPLSPPQGGTGSTSTPAESQILIGNGSKIYILTTIPNCIGSNKLLYNSSTRAFSCATDEGGGSGFTDAGTSTSAGIFTISTTTTKFILTIPPRNDQYFAPSSTIPTGGNPSASVGLTAINGTANTFLRSDGASSLSMTITPVWTGLHQFSVGGVSSSQLYSASTTLSTITSALVLTDSTGFITEYTGSACGGSDQVVSISATGVVTCSAQGTGGNGTVATTTPYTAGQIVIASSTDGFVSTISASRSLSIVGTALDVDSELYTKSFSASLAQPSSTLDLAFHQHKFVKPSTLTLVWCQTTSIGTTTLAIDRRSSSTPNTAGTSMIGNLDCGISRNTTSTFVVSTSTLDYLMNFTVSAATGIGSTSTLHFGVDYVLDD